VVSGGHKSPRSPTCQHRRVVVAHGRSWRTELSTVRLHRSDEPCARSVAQQAGVEEGATAGTEESVSTQEINEMVAAEVPQIFAGVAETEDRSDAIITAWGLKLPDRVEVVSAGPDGARGSFCSLEHARKLLSANGKITASTTTTAAVKIHRHLFTFS
jgi:hypothetical protein